MNSALQLKALPDDELLRRLAALLEGLRHAEPDVVAHIGEVDARRLYLREATPSMFVYCIERLHLAEAEAYLRIAAARASRQHPIILGMLADGRLDLSGIALLAPRLTPENREFVLQRATHKTKRQIEELIAELAPRNDVRSSIRKLPLGRVAASPGPSERVLPGPLRSRVEPPRDAPDGRGAALGVGPDGSATAIEPRPEQVDSDRLDDVAVRPALRSGAAGAPEREEPPGCTSEADFAQRWAASRHTIIDAAVTEKLERLEARRFGRTKSPRKRPRTQRARTDATGPGVTDTSASSRYVPADMRRVVHERDEGRCRYMDDQGRRCPARADLEFHHRRPFAVGGDRALSNISLLCQAHNTYLARIDFGPDAVGRHRRTTGVAPIPNST